jgi:hypothetical protein
MDLCNLVLRSILLVVLLHRYICAYMHRYRSNVTLVYHKLLPRPSRLWFAEVQVERSGVGRIKKKKKRKKKESKELLEPLELP